jgi:S-adenosylmethionine:tRNA ribosyltransferase-isomerase
MDLSDFDFPLPETQIALSPARPRDSARLLVVHPGGRLEDRIVRELAGILRPGDLMVFNDTRTIPAALKAVRPARSPEGGMVRVSLNLIERTGLDRWKALARPGKRLRCGDSLFFDSLFATVLDKDEDGVITLAFDQSGADLDQAIIRQGMMPLPPYIAARRAAGRADEVDYQTVYAKRDGSVATPTAGLHFTEALLAGLTHAGIEREHVTLHVGAGTFLPVKTDRVEDHVMHAEWCEVSEETAAALNRARRDGRRIVAVGTTSLRTLESVVDEKGCFRPFVGETRLFIRPGYRFRAVDILMTNFHTPKSTLLMLVSAFAGMATMRRAYAHAIASGYRLLSYGDASLLHRADG